MRLDPYSHRVSDEAGAWGWGYSSEQVDGAIADLDPFMAAINAGVDACAAVSPTDRTLWGQAYQRWQAVKQDWAFDKGGSIAPGPVYGASILARVQQSNDDATTYQAILARACPNLAPPAPNPLLGGGGANPQPPVPPDGDGIATALKWGAILAAVAVGAYVITQTGVPRLFRGGKK